MFEEVGVLNYLDMSTSLLERTIVSKHAILDIIFDKELGIYIITDIEKQVFLLSKDKKTILQSLIVNELSFSNTLHKKNPIILNKQLNKLFIYDDTNVY